MMTFFGAEAYLPLALSDVRGQSSTVAGLALSAGTLTWTAGSWLQERRARSGDRRTTVRAGLALVGAGIALLLPVAGSGPVWLALVAWSVAGLGIGMAYPSLSLIILAQATEHRAGAASATINTSGVVGSTAGTGLGAAIVGAGASGAWSTATSVTVVFAAMIAFVIVALVATRRLLSVDAPPAVEA
jgi:MFS family permease